MKSFAVSENVNNATLDGVCRVYVSDPLSGSGTLSGNVKGIIRCQENSTSANMQAQLLVKVVSRDGTTVRGTALAHQTAAGTEFGTALANRKFPLDWTTSPGTTLTGVAYSAGDRIVLEIGYRNNTANTTTFTATMSFGDNVGADLSEDQTGTAGNCPWIEFDSTLSFEIVPYPAGAFIQSGSGTASSQAIAVPTPFGGSQLQDDIVLCQVHHEGGTTVTGVPAGFVQIGTTTSSGTSEVLSSSTFAKRIGATPDSGTYTFTISASAWIQLLAGIIRNAYELSTVDVAFESVQSANNGATQVTTSANLTTTPTGNNRLAITSCDFFDGGTVTPPAGFDTSLTGSGVNNYMSFKHLNDTTAQSAQWTLSVADSMVSRLSAMIPRGATLGGSTFNNKPTHHFGAF
jgi:hypothetical protein